MSFDNVAVAMRRQHPQIHVKESRKEDGSGHKVQKAFTAGARRGGFQKPKQFKKNWQI